MPLNEQSTCFCRSSGLSGAVGGLYGRSTSVVLQAYIAGSAGCTITLSMSSTRLNNLQSIDQLASVVLQALSDTICGQHDHRASVVLLA